MLRVAFRAVAARSAQSAAVVAGPAAAARPLLVLAASKQQIHTSALLKDQSTGAESKETSKKLASKAKKATTSDGEAPATKKPRAAKAAGTKTPKKNPVGRPKLAEKDKVKKPKAPARPKRVLSPPTRISSPWILFFQDKLAQLDPEERKKPSEVAKKYGDEYRALPAEEKQALQKRVEEGLVQHEKDMAAYWEKVTPEMIQEENIYRRERRKNSPKKQKPRLLRDPSKPVAPLNGYMRFVEAVRASPELQRDAVKADKPFNELGVIEASKAVAAAWRSLSESDKQPYQDAYAKDKAVYDEQLAAWKANKGAEA